MGNSSLKNKATKGMFWNAVEKFSVQFGQLVIGIVLARLLIPEDYGLIGMLSIFIAISQTVVESGMGSGLIQKKNRTEIDYSTVFIFNFFVSVFIYAVLFFSAPLIADFYQKPQLTTLTRVLGLNVIINSFTVVQRAIFRIQIDFKSIAKVNVFSVFIAGISAIFFAYKGFGVWSLVIQHVTRALLTSILLWTFSNWKFSLHFSKDSFKDLFGFGSKLLFAGLYARAFNEIYNITIGKVYSASDLGFYTRAKQFAEILSGTVTSILHQVTYPILASLQDDKDRMVSVYSRLIKMTAFLIFPTMTLLSLLADPFIRLFLTEKWAPAIVLLQWMAFARIITPISVINMNILNAVGRSDLFLKVDLSKLPIIVIALIITIPIGVKAMVIGHVVTSGIAFFINAYMPGKLFRYGPFKQLKDMIPVLLSTAMMALAVIIVNSFIEGFLLQLVAGVFTALVSYFLFSYLLNIEELKELVDVFRSYLVKVTKNK